MMQPSRTNARRRSRPVIDAATSQETQILVLADLYGSVPEIELRQSLPSDYAERFVLRLTEFGVSRLSPNAHISSANWRDIGAAIEAIVARVDGLCAGATGRRLLLVAGYAPSAVFVHLGYCFALTPCQQFLAKPLSMGGEWDILLAESPKANIDHAKLFFDEITGLPTSPVPCSGRCAISIGCSDRSRADETLVDFIANEGDPIAGLVTIRSSHATSIARQKVASINHELLDFWATFSRRLPRSTGIALFFDGPDHVAYALGHSLRVGLPHRDIWLTNFRHPEHDLVYSLPFASATNTAFDDSENDEQSHQRVFATMTTAIREMQTLVAPKHLPADSMSESEAAVFIDRLQSIDLQRSPNEVLPFRISHGQLLLTNTLLRAFRETPAKLQENVAKLAVLRELFCHFRGARSIHPQAAHSSGILVEQFGIRANSFALRTLINSTFDTQRPENPTHLQHVVRDWIAVVLQEMETIDQLAHGSSIDQLTDRQLREYLTWHLQLARCHTIRKVAHVHELVAVPVFVELAPLATRTHSGKFEPVVRRAIDKTELICAIGDDIIRVARKPGFDPSGLVDAVRSFARAPIQSAMMSLVHENRSKLAPWGL